MLNSGLIFEMLSYSLVESTFYGDSERAAVYMDLIEKNFHSESPLLREAIVFNTLLNRKSSKLGASSFVAKTLKKLPSYETTVESFSTLLHSLKRSGVLQEIEDTFENMDEDYDSAFSNISYLIDSEYTGKDNSEIKKSVIEHVKGEYVGSSLKTSENGTFSDKVALLRVASKGSLTLEEQKLLVEVFASPLPILEFFNDRYNSIEKDVVGGAALIEELGTAGKIGVSAAVVALIIKKFNELRKAIETASKDQVQAIKGIRLESYMKSYLDFEDLLLEMKTIIGECEDE